MKTIYLSYFLSLLIIGHCNIGIVHDKPEQIELSGTIGKLNAQILLIHDKENVTGNFSYTDLKKPLIQLRGSMDGNKLVLREIGEGKELSGVFEGKYSNGNYIGFWYSQSNSKKVKFTFSKKAGKRQASNRGGQSPQRFKDLNPKELFEFHFKSYKKFKLEESTEGTYATYVMEEEGYIEGKKVMVHLQIDEYEENSQKYALAIFYHSFRGAGAENGTASIAKYQKVKDYWELVIFKEDCSWVGRRYGSVDKVRLKKIGNHFFLFVIREMSANGIDLTETSLHLHNISDFSESGTYIITVVTASSEYYSRVSFEQKNDTLLLRIEYEGTDLNSKYELIPKNDTEVYFYDEKALKFKEFYSATNRFVLCFGDDPSECLDFDGVF